MLSQCIRNALLSLLEHWTTQGRRLVVGGAGVVQGVSPASRAHGEPIEGSSPITQRGSAPPPLPEVHVLPFSWHPPNMISLRLTRRVGQSDMKVLSEFMSKEFLARLGAS